MHGETGKSHTYTHTPSFWPTYEDDDDDDDEEGGGGEDDEFRSAQMCVLKSSSFRLKIAFLKFAPLSSFDM